jgi:hypothetical protein
MTFKKESYFRQKLNTVYNQLIFYSKVITHVLNNFFIFSINHEEFLKTGRVHSVMNEQHGGFKCFAIFIVPWTILSDQKKF